MSFQIHTNPRFYCELIDLTSVEFNNFTVHCIIKIIIDIITDKKYLRYSYNVSDTILNICVRKSEYLHLTN